MVEVVAALIFRGDRFLICQRPVHKKRGLKWEYVGGKVEPGETKEEALIRECREELDIELNVNRYNKAQGFYLKHGFQIRRQGDFEIGNGYYMNDYIMGKTIG